MQRYNINDDFININGSQNHLYSMEAQIVFIFDIHINKNLDYIKLHSLS